MSETTKTAQYEDFEDFSLTKYIKGSEHIMECVYISQHKRWKPVGISSSNNISLRFLLLELLFFKIKLGEL